MGFSGLEIFFVIPSILCNFATCLVARKSYISHKVFGTVLEILWFDIFLNLLKFRTLSHPDHINPSTIGTSANAESPLLNARDVDRLHEMKRRQRYVEYVGLAAMQGFLAAGLLHATNLTASFGTMPLVFGAAWLLAQMREKRRTLGQHDTKRLMGDTIESFSIAAMMALLVIGSRWFTVGVGIAMTYLSMAILAYFLGSFIGEMWWASRVFPRYDLKHKVNYVINLNRSVIFPYNLRYLRSILRDTSSKTASFKRPPFRDGSGSSSS